MFDHGTGLVSVPRDRTPQRVAARFVSLLRDLKVAAQRKNPAEPTQDRSRIKP